MATAAEHYDRVLARHYSKLLGDFNAAVDRQIALLTALGLRGGAAALALDLGAGSGLHTLALARLGFSVTAVDHDATLLKELASRSDTYRIARVHADMRTFVNAPTGPFDAIVCMGDSLSHLESAADVDALLTKCATLLRPDGMLVLTFRDLTVARQGLDRFIPLYQDATTIMTCFLEYEPAAVKVHDLIHERQGDGHWRLTTGFYRKLRLRPDRIVSRIEALDIAITCNEIREGQVVIAARKPRAGR